MWLTSGFGPFRPGYSCVSPGGWMEPSPWSFGPFPIEFPPRKVGGGLVPGSYGISAVREKLWSAGSRTAVGKPRSAVTCAVGAHASVVLIRRARTAVIRALRPRSNHDSGGTTPSLDRRKQQSPFARA